MKTSPVNIYMEKYEVREKQLAARLFPLAYNEALDAATIRAKLRRLLQQMQQED